LSSNQNEYASSSHAPDKTSLLPARRPKLKPRPPVHHESDTRSVKAKIWWRRWKVFCQMAITFLVSSRLLQASMIRYSRFQLSP